MTNRIDTDRLTHITERATMLQAQTRGVYETLREVQDQIRLLVRQRQATAMPLEDLRIKDTGDLERQDARIEALRRVAAEREKQHAAALEKSTPAYRLAERCLAYARERGVKLPTEHHLATGLIGAIGQ